MKILLILIATSCLVSCLGVPVDYQQKITENERRQNVQAAQNLDRDESKTREERYQLSQTTNQPIRREYRRFGNDAKPLNSDTDSLASSYTTGERKTIQNQPSSLNTVTDKNEVDKFQSPSIKDESRFQRSSFQQQDSQSISRFPYDPTSQIQSTFLNQESFVPGRENVGNQLSFTSIHNQESSNRGNPSSLGDRSEVPSGMYRDTFGATFPTGQEQITLNDGAMIQNQFRSVEDLRFQNPENFYRTDAENRGVRQEQQNFPQQESFIKQDQITSSQGSQGQINQYQIENSPAPFSPLEKDSFFHQGQVDFDSRRISSTSPNNQPMGRASGDQNKFMSSSAIFPRNQPSEKSQDRQISDFRNVQLKEGERIQIDGQNFEKMQDGLYHSIEQNQPVQVGSKFPQNSSPIIVSGMKGTPVTPALVYKTGGAAAPHAVVLGKDMSVLNKASISQHVQTPYIQYTYSHSL